LLWRWSFPLSQIRVVLERLCCGGTAGNATRYERLQEGECSAGSPRHHIPQSPAGVLQRTLAPARTLRESQLGVIEHSERCAAWVLQLRLLRPA
jgi:hypothetical protein